MPPVLPDGAPQKIGPYRILGELGAGGMGTVFLGEDAAGRRCAVKLLLRVSAGDEASVKRLYREARSARGAVHPNLCPVYDVGQDRDHFYLVMALVAGRTLAETLAAGTSLSTTQALKLVRTLADALQAAHEAGIVHRDLKPANVMLRPDGTPVIIDFGMARRFDNTETLLTLTGSIAGTPGYMAPEQITGSSDEIGPACDIYALGVVLYELLTGWTPFSGNLATILGSIVSEPPPPPRTRCPDLDPVLDAVCLRALAKHPADRFDSARQFADIIDVYLHDGPAAASRMIPDAAPFTPPVSPQPAAPEPGLLARLLNALRGRK